MTQEVRHGEGLKRNAPAGLIIPRNVSVAHASMDRGGRCMEAYAHCFKVSGLMLMSTVRSRMVQAVMLAERPSVPPSRRTPGGVTHPGPALTLFALTLPLLNSGRSRPPRATTPDPYAGGASFPWKANATDLSALLLTPGLNTLQFETPTFATNGWRGVRSVAFTAPGRAGGASLVLPTSYMQVLLVGTDAGANPFNDQGFQVARFDGR